MRVLITSFGTRGDIQPYVALAASLRGAGHEVTLAVPEAFRALARSAVADAGFVPAGSALLNLVQDEMPTMRGPRGTVRLLGRMRSAMRRHMVDQWRAARSAEPDLIVYHPKTLAAPHIAERLGVPGVLSLPIPLMTPTGQFPAPFGLGRTLGTRLNRASYLFRYAGNAMYGRMINEFRHRIGLRSASWFADPLRAPDGAPVPVLYPFSRHVAPVPADYPPSVHVTGYWFLPHDDGWRPAPLLADFLAAGERPVYVGFGSMGFGMGADERRDAVLSALRTNRLRGVVATGWGGLTAGDAPSDDVLVVDEVPHDWLFPRVRAVVHHGGAGSTGAGLRAGRPTLICPFLADQPFWGLRVHEIGAGPPPLSSWRLGAGLAERLGRLVGEPSYRRRAAEIGERIRAEDGTAEAVCVLESIGS
ncbi:glycosyltransferase [Georgenia alba]|uniref:Glycosyltransferase n=1 Tax=Georgenia alba TaxID=2233858 RepID=A0ABW2Q310_9MICO